jgi:hypothetical protein
MAVTRSVTAQARGDPLPACDQDKRPAAARQQRQDLLAAARVVKQQHATLRQLAPPQRRPLLHAIGDGAGQDVDGKQQGGQHVDRLDRPSLILVTIETDK